MEYLLKASAVVTLFYLCYKLFLQRETFFESNRWFLLIGLVIAFTMPFIVIPIYVSAEPAQLQNILVTGDTIPVATAINSEKPFDILQLIIGSYIIGVLFFLGRFILQFGSLGFILLNNDRKKKGPYTYIKTNNTTSPFSFFKWIVYNPNQFSETELKQILTHEKIHAGQYHSIDIIITRLASIIFWFNPIVWLYKKELQQNLEFIADQNTQDQFNCKKTYQHLLLKTSVPNYEMALTNNFYNSLIKKRIVMLHQNRSQNKNQWKYAIIIPVLTLFLMSFNTKEIIKYDENQNPLNAENQSSVDNGDIEMVMITKDFTDADFNKLKKEFAGKGITLKFKNIKRNSDGEITAIKIDISSKKASANFNADSKDPIDPIKVTFDSENDKISIGNSSDLHFGEGYVFETKDGSTKLHTSEKSGNVFVYSSSSSSDDHDKQKYEIRVKGEDGKTIIKKSHTVHDIKINDTDEDHNVFVISDEDDRKKIEIIHSAIKEAKTNVKLSGNVVIDVATDIKNNVKFVSDDVNTVYEYKTLGKNSDTKFFISGDPKKEPLYILNDKEISKKKLDNLLETNNIESINVLKGKAAIEKYGKKAKNGAVVIITKDKK